MSLYGLIFGKNPSEKLLGMLDLSENDFPRYRNVFIKDADDDEANKGDRLIYVYTRAGSDNICDSFSDEIDYLQMHPQHLRDYDDSGDSTYKTFVFGVPEQWHAAYDEFRAELKAQKNKTDS